MTQPRGIGGDRPSPGLQASRARCERHGLAYDPGRFSGCVLCRKEDGVAETRALAPHGPTVPVRSAVESIKAQREKRLAARLIDGVIYMGIIFVIMIPLVLVTPTKPGEPGHNGVVLAYTVLLLVSARRA